MLKKIKLFSFCLIPLLFTVELSGCKSNVVPDLTNHILAKESFAYLIYNKQNPTSSEVYRKVWAKISSTDPQEKNSFQNIIHNNPSYIDGKFKSDIKGKTAEQKYRHMKFYQYTLDEESLDIFDDLQVKEIVNYVVHQHEARKEARTGGIKYKITYTRERIGIDKSPLILFFSEGKYAGFTTKVTADTEIKSDHPVDASKDDSFMGMIVRHIIKREWQISKK